MAILDPTVATLTAVSLTPAVLGQLIPPAYQGPNPADRRRYQQGAGVAVFLGVSLSVLAGQIAPLVLAAASAGALIALREWSMHGSACRGCNSYQCECAR